MENSLKEKIKTEQAITLIALVITIIVLLILAAISIVALTGKNGILTKAIEAREETQIKAYHEKIELIRTELRLNKENYEPPTLQELQDEFNYHQKTWVDTAEIKLIEGIEKIELITKEKYIFHITETSTEYRGKDGKVVDIEDLNNENVISLKIVGDGKNGKLVEIRYLGEKDYFKIEYQIDSEEGEWEEIESGGKVDVGYGSTIHARLTYVSNKGITVSLSVGDSDPVVTAKSIDTSNITRKTEQSLSDLFKITWGSEGPGEVQYNVTGNLNFNNTDLPSSNISNLSELEIGNYEVTCKLISPSNKEATATKEVKITKLANTSVTNENDASVDAYAIYSKYDLAYFRDLVNTKQQFTINAKLMDPIDMEEISGSTWAPIGYAKNDFSVASGTVEAEESNSYSGIFDGNKKTISNLKINHSDATITLGLFGAVKNGTIKNCILENVNIVGNRIVGSLVGYMNHSNITNCKVSGNIQGIYSTGGIAGFIDNESTIYASKSEETMTLNNNATNNFGGIVGVLRNHSNVSHCYMSGGGINGRNSNGNIGAVGGIVGRSCSAGTVEYVYNNATIDVNGSHIAGIIGSIEGSTNNQGYSNVTNCYNLGTIKGTKKVPQFLAGIVAYCEGQNNGRRVIITNVYNKGTIQSGGTVGGIIGQGTYNTLKGELLNYGAISDYESYIGAIYGYGGENNVSEFTKRAYGGNCSSSLKANGNGSTNNYDSNLVMPSVYSIVNASNTGEFVVEGTNEETPKLKDIE